MELEQLTEAEAEQLQELLNRAIANNQFNLQIASEGMDGHSINSANWETEIAECEGECPVDPEKEDGPWMEYKQHEVTVFIDDRGAQFLAGNIGIGKRAA